MGGLGNQLFQIFATISYALKTNNEYKFLNIKTLGGGGSTLRYTFWDTFLKELIPYLTNEFPELALVKQDSFEFKELPLSLIKNRNVCIHGYFQSYKYFEENFSLIYKLLGIDERKKEVLEKLKLDSSLKNDLPNAISMHFRLGDYKKFAYFHPILPSSYYAKSIQTILEKDKDKNKDLYVKKVFYFCEEEDLETVEQTILYCKDLFPQLNFTRISNEFQDWEQLLIMSECKHHIIANSSFSWWGACFGYQEAKDKNREKEEKEEKIICYPSLWFVPTAKENTKDLYPPDWMKINV
jgi:hypothetical protein